MSTGLNFPRMTTAERDAIPLPTTDQVIFNTDINTHEVFDGVSWIEFGAGGGGGGSTFLARFTLGPQNLSGAQSNLLEFKSAEQDTDALLGSPNDTFLTFANSGTYYVHIILNLGNQPTNPTANLDLLINGSLLAGQTFTLLGLGAGNSAQISVTASVTVTASDTLSLDLFLPTNASNIVDTSRVFIQRAGDGGGGGGGAVTSVNGQTGVVVLDPDDLNDAATTNKFTSAGDISKLAGIEVGATADQTDPEIETAYNNQVPIVSQADAEAGTSTTVNRWTPQRVGQAIAALGGGGGGGSLQTTRVSRNSTLALSTGSPTDIPFQVEDVDQDNQFDLVGNPSQIVISTTGQYFVGMTLFLSGTSFDWQWFLNVNGASIDQETFVNSSTTTKDTRWTLNRRSNVQFGLSAGDIITLQVIPVAPSLLVEPKTKLWVTRI